MIGKIIGCFCFSIPAIFYFFIFISTIREAKIFALINLFISLLFTAICCIIIGV